MHHAGGISLLYLSMMVVLLLTLDFPVKPAFIACSVHKWLNGPYGLSLVYVSPVHHVEWGPLKLSPQAIQSYLMSLTDSM